MKLSSETITILRNFAGINQHLYFQAGDVLSTITAQGHIFAQAKIQENFPKSFAIYNLLKFLNVVGLFEDPEIEFGDKSVKIIHNSESANYIYADPTAIVYPKVTNIELPESKFKFKLSSEYVSSIDKMAKALDVDDLSILTDGSDINIKVHDKKDPSNNSHVISIDETSTEPFDIRFKIANLKILPGNYLLEIAIKNNIAVGIFTNETTNVKYWISSEADSKF